MLLNETDFNRVNKLVKGYGGGGPNSVTLIAIERAEKKKPHGIRRT